MDIEQLGPYKIGRKLGRGGMGTVYAASLIDTGEVAAVKILSANLAHDEGFRERFKSEIETLRKLSHPNIVRIYGFGEQRGHLFYSMELVEGRSLEDEIQGGRRFNWREVTDYAVQTCRALKHAHDRGVIHRDIKPANLLYSSEGQIKLSDFGIAKLFGNSGMTAVGGVLGTAEYMAPEQTDGRAITPRCDLYSLGGVMYTLLAGRPPFKATTVVEMLQLQRYAEPDPVRFYAPDVPEELQGLIAELLVKDPEKRIATAVVLMRRLESMRHGLSARVDPILTAPTQVVPFPPGQQPPPISPQPPVSVSSATMTAPGPATPVPPARTDEDYELDDPVSSKDATAAARHERALSMTVDLVSQTTGGKSQTAVQEPDSASGRFVSIQKDEAHAHAAGERTSHWATLQTALLAAAVMTLALGTYWLMQPASADRLFERIAAAAETGDIEKLRDKTNDINSFLAHYGDDARAPTVRQHKDDIDLYLKERRAEVRGRAVGNEMDSPLERAYQEAINYEKFSPELAVERFAALVALYGGADNLSAADRDVLMLARKHLSMLSTQTEQRATNELQLLRERMNAADQIELSDPQAARAIREAVVKLYADKPWAAEAVERAQAALAARTAAGNHTAP